MLRAGVMMIDGYAAWDFSFGGGLGVIMGWC